MDMWEVKYISNAKSDYTKLANLVISLLPKLEKILAGDAQGQMLIKAATTKPLPSKQRPKKKIVSST